MVRTFWRTPEKLPKVWDFVREQLAQGRQAFVVYPRVDESGPSALKAVTAEAGTLEKQLSPYSVGLIHGRMNSLERASVMARFREGKIQVLLATSLIEVGVDVPNATVMLIENAEQFGLAQLHQLRGRIGRGAHESYCILIASAKSPEAQERLRLLCDTADGFKIAEADLRLRGPGDMLGHEQSGLTALRFGNLAQDLTLVEKARDLAAKILAVPRKSRTADGPRLQ
jgi:ATP-dependent DNA helicase RecG